MIYRNRCFLNLALSAVLLCIVGCGEPVGPTSGMVQFEDGLPVESGSVELRRLTDKQRYSGRILSNGTFKPADQDGNVGLPPGEYEAVVVQIVLTEDLAADDHTHGYTVPRRYADYYTSGLRVIVTPGQVEPIKISIVSGKGTKE